MSGTGAPTRVTLEAQGLTVAIVAASWHAEVMAGLVDGAQRVCEQAEVQYEVVRVPGAFELPVVAANLAPDVDAIVALGVVIRGATPHFEYVCRAATDGLVRVGLDSGKPIGFGILTCDTDEQALDRAGLSGSNEDKGAEAAHAAIETAVLLRSLANRSRKPGLGFSA